MLTFLLEVLSRFVADFMDPFFLIPAARALVKSIVSLFLFGLVVHLVALI